MKKLWLLILVPSILCILCITTYYGIFSLPIGSHPVDHIESLLVTPNEFPPGWEVDYTGPLLGEEDWGEENIEIGLKRNPGPGYAINHVYRFSGALDAMRGHFLMKKGLLIGKENPINFLDYKSPIANDWYKVCGDTSSGGIVCDVFGRYEDYVVYFTIGVPRDQITAEQLEKILQSIDNRMGDLLMK